MKKCSSYNKSKPISVLNIKVSIVIPVYNVDKYLHKCLDCIANQSLKEIEVICVNDGSTDMSLSILENYAKKDKRFIVFNQQNQGAGQSRNNGLNYATGEYLLFMDADDWIDKRFCEELYNAAKAGKADIVETTKSYNFYTNGHQELFNKRKMIGFVANGNYFRRDVVWDKLFRADFVRKNNILFSNGLCHNDAFFTLQSLYYSNKIVKVDTAIYYHNKGNENSIRHTKTDKKLLSQLDMFIIEIDFINSHYFSYDEYKHNYHKLYKTAKRKYKYIKAVDAKIEYKKKLLYIKQNNKFPYPKILAGIKNLFSRKHREEYAAKLIPLDRYPEELKKKYFSKMKRQLDLNNPVSFNEKIQWLKLYDSTPLKSLLADKYRSKKYVGNLIGEDHIIPLLGVWDNFDDIDFEMLPDSFVLKCNHGCRMNLIVKDKSKLNLKKAKKNFDTWMKEDFGLMKGFQLHYCSIPRKIIAEEYVNLNEKGVVKEYKFYCYNDKCRHVLVCEEGDTKKEYINFDMDYNCLMLSPRSTYREKILLPDNFDEMVKIAEKLSQGFLFVRVDLYNTKGKIYFSEMTFTPGSGFNTYYPEWDNKLGSYLRLNHLEKVNE